MLTFPEPTAFRSVACHWYLFSECVCPRVWVVKGNRCVSDAALAALWKLARILPKAKNTACLDADKLKAPLYLRHWQKGDWFIPFGMRGRKKLSDYFSDHKWNLLQKEQAWLLCSGDDIIWLVGERTDDRFKLDKTTKNCLILKYFDWN